MLSTSTVRRSYYSFYPRKWSKSDPICEEVTWEMGRLGVYAMTISKLFAREQGPILMGGEGGGLCCP